jgi:hypothetical protein
MHYHMFGLTCMFYLEYLTIYRNDFYILSYYQANLNSTVTVTQKVITDHLL